MEVSHKTHRPHIKVGKDAEEEDEKFSTYRREWQNEKQDGNRMSEHFKRGDR